MYKRQDQASKYVGNYTDREIHMDNGELIYRRVGNTAYRSIVCFEEDKFMIEGVKGFYLHFERDADGHITAINGRYEQGHSDKSPRVDENG